MILGAAEVAGLPDHASVDDAAEASGGVGRAALLERRHCEPRGSSLAGPCRPWHLPWCRLGAFLGTLYLLGPSSAGSCTSYLPLKPLPLELAGFRYHARILPPMLGVVCSLLSAPAQPPQRTRRLDARLKACGSPARSPTGTHVPPTPPQIYIHTHSHCRAKRGMRICTKEKGRKISTYTTLDLPLGRTRKGAGMQASPNTPPQARCNFSAGLPMPAIPAA